MCNMIPFLFIGESYNRFEAGEKGKHTAKSAASSVRKELATGAHFFKGG